MVRFINDSDEKEKIAAIILNALPEWFGMPESTQKYIHDSSDMPFWAYYDENGEPKGFIVLKETGRAAAEIYVMGVMRECHRHGIGTALWKSFRNYAKQKGYEYVQVKTVQSGKYPEYDMTNLFYQKLGFKELEVLPALWDPWNPCQIYIQFIGQEEIYE